MATLRGQEALDYIAKNPTGYKLISGPEEYKAKAAGSGNFFTNLLRAGLIDPFAKLMEGVGNITTSIQNERYGTDIGYTPITGGLLGQKALEQAKEDPLLTAAKGAAGIGALAVPGSIGGGFKGAIGSGALGGSLGGFGASEGEDLISSLGDAGKGAALGGVAGGLLYGAGKGLEKVKSGKLSKAAAGKSDDLAEDIIKGDVTVAGNRTVGKVSKRAADARKALEKAGVKVSDAETMALQADDITSKLANQKRALLRDSAYQMGSDDFMNAIQKTKAFKDNPSLINEKALKPYIEMMNTRGVERGGVLRADDLYDVIRSIDDELYAISSGTVAPKSTASNKALKALRDSLSKEIKSVPGVADIDKTIAPIQNWLKTDSSYAIRRQSGSQPIVQSSIPGSSMFGTGRLLNKAKASTANVLDSIAGAAERGVPGAGLFNNLAGQSGRIGAGLGILSNLGMPQAQQEQIDPLQALTGAYGVQPQIGQQPQLDFLSAIQVAQQLIPYGSESEVLSYAQALMKQYNEGTTTLSEEQQTLDRSLAQLEQLYGLGTDQSLAASSSAGIGGLIARLGQDVRGATSQDFRDRLNIYNNAREQAVGLVNQLRGAGVLNEAEREQMIATLPNENSTEREARAWFDNIRQLYLSRRIDPMQQGGQDILGVLGGY